MKYISIVLLLSLCSRCYADDDCYGLSSVDIVNDVGACKIHNAYSYYEGEPLDIDAHEGDIAGKVYINYDVGCMLPDKTTKDNYIQLGVSFTESVIENNKIESNIGGATYFSSNLGRLGGVDGHRIIMIMTSPVSGGGSGNPSHIIAKREVTIDGKKFWCGQHSAAGVEISTLHRGVGAISPGEYAVNSSKPAYIVTARYTTGGGTKNTNITVTDAKLTIGSATCRFKENGGDLIVNVNDGVPMSPSDFANIATQFKVQLLCSSVKMPVNYKIKAHNDIGYLSDGIFGLTSEINSAKGVGYKISHVKNGVIGSAVDLTQVIHSEEKAGDLTSYDLSFSVSPVRLPKSLSSSGVANAVLTMELIYD
ncbi:hypothetical protein ACV1EC_20810 [Aeromonas hydrophila]